MAQLPAYSGGNALDLRGLNSGLDELGNAFEKQRQYGNALAIGGKAAKGDYNGAAAQAYGQGDLQTGMGMQKFQQDKALKDVEVKKAQATELGNLAQAADAERDPVKRQQMFQVVLDKHAKDHPDEANLPDIYKNPTTGPKLFAAQAGHVRDELDTQMKKAQIAASGAEANKNNALAAAAGIHEIGTDKFGAKIFGKIDRSTGQMVPFNVQGAGGVGGVTSQAPSGPQLTGKDYTDNLAKSDPGMAATVSSVLQGGQMPVGRTGYAQRVMEQASLADPTFNTATYATRQKAALDLRPAGPVGSSLAALGTVAQHLGELQKAADGLNNSAVPGINAPLNAVMGRVSDTAQANQQNFKTTLNGVASEMTRVFRGAGGAVSDVEHWRDAFPMNGSPAAQKAAIQTGIQMIADRVDEMKRSHSNTFGADQNLMEKVSPGARKLFERGYQAPPTAGGPPAPGGGPPAPADAISQAKAAIAAGKDPTLIKQRLQKMGIDPAGL